MCPHAISCAVTHPSALAGQRPHAPDAGGCVHTDTRGAGSQPHADLVLSHLLEITRDTIQKKCFVSLRILKEALNDLKRNDLNKRTKKET